MVIFQRNELSRNRLLYILAIVLAVSSLVTVLTEYGRSSQTAQAAYILLGIAAVGVLVLGHSTLFDSKAKPRPHYPALPGNDRRHQCDS